MSQKPTEKKPCATTLYSIDWVDWFLDGVNPISSSTWSIIGSATLGASGINASFASVYVSGGTSGETLVLTNTITDNVTAETDCCDVYINVL